MKDITIELSAGTGKGYEYSVEAGLSDGENHFDHHGPHKENPCPANDARITEIPNGSTIGITHLDADTYIGLLRMLGKPLPDIDLEMVEKIDLNGSSIIKDMFDPTLVYMVGVGTVARQLHFPRVSENQIDVTEIINKMTSYPQRIFMDAGKMAQKAVEQAYELCLVDSKDIVGLWSVGSYDSFDPSRPYRDGIDIVVVFRSHYKSISIYCSPDSLYRFVERTIAGIEFAGHPKACGSPRGTEYTLEDAKRVFKAIVFHK
jgi:hypothetical protein